MHLDVIEHGIEYYKDAVGEGISPLIFIQCAGALLIFLVIRFVILVNIENVSFRSSSPEHRSKQYFLLSHVAMEALIGFAVTYTLIILRDSQVYNYIWNILIAPGIGLMAGIFVDLKFMMKTESDAPLSLSIYSSVKKSSSGDSKPPVAGPSNNLAPRINIQVNTGNGTMDSTQNENSNKESKPKEKSKPEVNNDSKTVTIDDIASESSNIESDETNFQITKQININNSQQQEEESTMKEVRINESSEDIIKSLIDMQEQQALALKSMSGVIDAMRENIVTNMRFELHDQMMECVARGYMTPIEYERVTEKMHNYSSLGGNHGLTSLYDEKFKVLPIK